MESDHAQHAVLQRYQMLQKFGLSPQSSKTKAGGELVSCTQKTAPLLY